MAVFEKKIQRRCQLDDTDVLTCTVESSLKIQGHTEYIIRVQRGPIPEKCWHVSKRYSDFAALHNILSSSGLSLPLPPKRLIGNMDPIFVAERQVALQNYLNIIQQNLILASSFPVKEFLDPEHYSSSLQDSALHSVSLLLRGEPMWEVVQPLPDLGWRVRKYYFSIKKHVPNQHDQQLLLSWTEYGPDLNIEISQLQSVLSSLMAVQAPLSVNLEFVRCNEVGCLIVRRIIEKGSLRDVICGSKWNAPMLRKHVCPKQISPFSGRELVLYSHQILQLLAILHQKGIPYGQLHAGNVCIENGRVLLLDIEGGLLGLPSFYRAFITQHRRLDTMQHVDMFCYGHLLYEMSFGRPLQTSSMESVPSPCSPALVDLLKKLLSPPALREALPTAQQMLQHEFFKVLFAEEVQSYPTFKLPAHCKEAFKVLTHKIEERLRQDQKMVYHQRRLSKVKEMLGSEEEKKRQKQKWKQIEKDKHQQQQLMNGKSPERSESPASTSTATSAGTMTPPLGQSESNLATIPTQAHSTASIPSPPPPPQPSGLLSRTVSSERGALLSSISGFNKSCLRRVSSPR